MFTGLVEELGEVVAVDRGPDSLVVTLAAGITAQGVRIGDSIAVNGCCLTVVELDESRRGPVHAEHLNVHWSAHVMAESLARTTLGGLLPGDRVNLERAMSAEGRLGGHVVQGHVDGVATLTDRTPGDGWEVVGFDLDPALAAGVVEKGSITLDGVSLTVVQAPPATGGRLTVSLIPETLQRTTLGHRLPGDRVNVELDVLGKYVARALGPTVDAAVDAAVRRVLGELLQGTDVQDLLEGKGN